MGIMSGIKDLAITTAMKSKVTEIIKPYGVLEAIEWNSEQKRLKVTARLEGETESVTITVRGFTLETDSSGNQYLIPSSAETSRPWLTTALNQFVVGKRFKLPDSIASVVQKIL